MKKYLVGLGNPGEDYVNSRHNAGSMLVDFLSKNMKELKEKKIKDCKVYMNSRDMVLIKPEVFMNSSGKAVLDVVKWLDIDVESSLMVAHDDLDLQLGKFKVQFGRSPKKHNGVLAVENCLGTIKFKRIRIGVDNRDDYYIEGAKYVLSKFKDKELVTLNSVFMELYKEIV